MKLGTICQYHQIAPLTKLFSTQLFGFIAYHIALDQTEMFPTKSHEALCMFPKLIFSDKLSVFEGQIAFSWILSAFTTET